MISNGRTRVLLVDDHPLFREGLAIALHAEPDLEVVAQAGNADELRAMATGVDADLAVVDVLMPSVSGIGITRELREHTPGCRVLGLSAIEEPFAIAEMLRAGASGFALKTQPPSEILEAVRRTAAGDGYLPPSVSREAIEAELAGGAPTSLAHLTPREREIFELMIRGHSNPAIASRLYISLRTVETHRHRIVKKVSVRSIVEMQRLAARYGGL
jgi:two-component system, NarL family, nitrate/nitrite response regulator NarL